MSIGGKSLHKKDWLKVGAAVGVAVGAPYLAGLLGPAAAGAGAAGAGLAEVGAGGALAGAGLGAGTGAAMFGPSAAGAGLLGSYAAPAAAAPMFTTLGSGAALADMGLGTAGMFGAGTANAATLAGMGITPEMSSGGINWGKGLKALQNAQKLQQLAQGPERQEVAPMQRPQPQIMSNSDVMKLWKQIYGGTA
jgi:hypothetical protein